MPTLPCLPAWFGGMLLCRGAAMGQVGPVFVGGPWVFDGGGAKAASGGPLLANSPVQLPRIRFLLGMRVVGSHDRGPACVLWMRLGEKLCRGGTRLW